MAETKPTNKDIDFSAITTDTNPGTGGGSRNYINLGGIKICWGVATSVTGAAAPTTYGITFPTSFFSATPAFTATVGPNATTNDQVLNIAGGSLSATGVGVNVLAATTTSAESVQWIAIGV